VYDLLNMGEQARTGSNGRLDVRNSSATLNMAAKFGITEVALTTLGRPEEFCSRVSED
jgi:hypothetical protein